MQDEHATGLFGVPELEFLAEQPQEGTPAGIFEQWLAVRRTGLTGSDVAAIFGEHSQRREIDVFYDKRPDLAPPELLAKMLADRAMENRRTRSGRQLEPVVAEWFARGEPDWERPGAPYVSIAVPTMRRRDRPWQVISPDRALYDPDRAVTLHLAKWPVDEDDGRRLRQGGDFTDPDDDAWIASALMVHRPDGGVEIKTHGFAYGRHLPDPSDEGAEFELPARLRLQSLWYASGLNQPLWHAAALVDTHLQHTWPIRALPEIVDPMLEEAERWWKLHVELGEVPSPDGSDSFQRHLRALYRTHDDVTLPARRDVDRLAMSLKTQTIIQAKAKAEIAELKQRIQEVIGTHLGIESVEGTMTWKETANGTPGWKAIAHAIAHQHGMTDAEINEVVSANTPRGVRRFNTPQWTRGLK